MKNDLTNLYVNDQLLDAIRAGAKVVLPVSMSLMARVSYSPVLKLTQQLGVDPPFVVAPLQGPWVSPEITRQTEMLSRQGFSLLPVDHPQILSEHVKARWARGLAAYQDLSSLALKSPWPAWSRGSCTNDIALIPVLQTLRRNFHSAPVVLATWGSNVSPLPSSPVTGGLIRWTPVQHHDVETLLAMAGNSETDMKPCQICRLCPMQSAASIRKTAKNIDPSVVQTLADIEAETTFPFMDRHWLGEMLASVMSLAQLECHARVQARSALREAAEMMIPKGRALQAVSDATPVNTAEASAIATSRQMVSEALCIPIKFTTGEEVREVLNLRHSTAPPVRFSLLPKAGQGIRAA